MKRLFALPAFLAVMVGTIGCTGGTTPDSALRVVEGYAGSRDGVQLYFRMVGEGSDTIVVLHGGPGMDQGYLAPDLEFLADSFTLIFYDQRGSGRSTLISDPAHVHMDAHVADIEDVRRHFGIERMVLLGHSWGALPGARYALAHPEHLSALILVGASPPRREPHVPQFSRDRSAWQDDETRANIEALRIARDTAADWRAVCRAQYTISVRGMMHDPHDMAMIDRMRGDRCTASAEAIRNGQVVNRLSWESIGDWDWREEFRDVTVPLLIIHGASDPMPMESAREWVEAFREASLVVLEDAGHYPFVERPEAFLQVVREFLR
jgi:proline iminopeptidase